MTKSVFLIPVQTHRVEKLDKSKPSGLPHGDQSAFAVIKMQFCVRPDDGTLYWSVWTSPTPSHPILSSIICIGSSASQSQQFASSLAFSTEKQTISPSLSISFSRKPTLITDSIDSLLSTLSVYTGYDRSSNECYKNGCAAQANRKSLMFFFFNKL